MAPIYSRVLATGALLATFGSLAGADSTYTISTSSNWGTWQGWGTSLAWWAVKFGDEKTLAEIFFTTDTVTWGSQSLPGLGMNIVRYNAGACSTVSYDGESEVLSSNMPASREVEAFWINWASTSSSSSSWDWSNDPNQRQMLTYAVDRGVDYVELFSNSPVWWMCTNHNPSGNSDGSDDNLQTWNYQNHALNLATIAAYAKSNWGIDFYSVEAFNEPMSDWWTSTGTQEGCHFEVDTQQDVIIYLRNELNSAGLSSVLVAASDENTYTLAISTWADLNSTAQGDVGKINVHGYEGTGGRRDTLYSLASAAGKKLWNSEYGDSDESGENMVVNLMLDFRWLHPTAYVYWQVLDGSGWGLIDADIAAGTTGVANLKYFVLAHFTRHIREGMEILDGGAGNVIPAYDATNHKLVIVAVNWSGAQYLNFELTDFSTYPSTGTYVKRWATDISGSGDQYEEYDNDTVIESGKFWSYFNNATIQTFEISGIYI